MNRTMRAAVCVRAGGPEVLEIHELPIPAVREGWSLVQVKGAGLNRSELRTRQGHSPNVTFPRVLGIECVGIVAASMDALGIVPGRAGRMLIRGGTSSVGMAAASIASGYGLKTAATTRRQSKADALTEAGIDHVLIDDGGPLTAGMHAVWPEGPDYVPDLVGARTAVDSLHLVRRGGTVCVTGSLSGWLIQDFEPIAMIPSGTKLTAFHSDNAKGSAGAAVLQRVVREVEASVYRPNVDHVFRLDDIVAAHRYMESDQATGKLVVVP